MPQTSPMLWTLFSIIIIVTLTLLMTWTNLSYKIMTPKTGQKMNSIASLKWTF